MVASNSRLMARVCSRTRRFGLDLTAVNANMPRRDTYELFLRDVLASQRGREHTDDYAVIFHAVAGQECAVSASRRPASRCS
jgi:hypothetical protein